MDREPSPGFQLDDNPRQFRREQRMQRVAWPAMFVLLLAATFGLFGQGPISSVQLRSDDGRVQVDSERFMRRRSDSHLELRLRAQNTTLRLDFDSRYAQGLAIDKVFPEPERRVAAAGVVSYVFSTEPGAGPVTVRLTARPEALGRLQGWLSVDGGPRVALRHFVYP